jgi:hypothetical protein
MINKRFTISVAEINAMTDKVFNIELTKTNTSVTGNSDTRYLYPLEIQIINTSGAGVEWLLISNEEEYTEYTANPGDFVFVRLPNNFTLQDNFNSLGRCYKFIIKGYEATAAEDLICEFINYKPSLRSTT